MARHGGPALQFESGGITVQVQGLRELLRALQSAGVDAEDISDLMQRMGEVTIEHIQPYVPVSTGTLLDSLRAGHGKTKATVTAGSKKRVPYAYVQNYGWPKHNLEPTNFIERGKEDAQPALLETLSEGIDTLLEKHHIAVKDL